ncbi:MAG TPA: DUF72 domain-containing protein [Candidatus Methanoperedens sp.]|nr:DUF72 domain-containing protein [Candidatus Methanoperedens sp.]
MRFAFRELHPQVSFGTASDRYAGWLGQIYTPERWAGRITRRTHEVGGKSYVEEVLPVESVEEYFRHFGALELDFTFYRPLLDEHLHPTDTFHLVRTYAGHLRAGDRLFLKAPQAVVAPRVRRGGGFAANPDYLDADFFTHRFYAPAVKLLHEHLAGILFEQEYRRAAERDAVEDEAADLERFFRRIPPDKRYHLELRTERYLAAPVFAVLARTGVGQAFSHWTWLPPLAEQFERSGGRFFNAGGDVLIRLMTPHGMRYEEAFARAHPFDRLVEGMLSERMLADTAAIVRRALAADRQVTVIVNNRSGGNAPLIAERLAAELLRPGTVPSASAG